MQFSTVLPMVLVSECCSAVRVGEPCPLLDTSHGDNHPILAAFLRAYNSHEDVILSPDDIWLMICIYFAKYANQNADKLDHWHANASENKSVTIENEQSIGTK